MRMSLNGVDRIEPLVYQTFVSPSGGSSDPEDAFRLEVTDVSLTKLQDYEGLWMLSYHYTDMEIKARRQYLTDSEKKNPWDYQGYIDALMPLRQQSIAEVEEYLSQARQRGLIYKKAVRRPPEIQGEGEDMPAILLGPKK